MDSDRNACIGNRSYRSYRNERPAKFEHVKQSGFFRKKDYNEYDASEQHKVVAVLRPRDRWRCRNEKRTRCLRTQKRPQEEHSTYDGNSRTRFQRVPFYLLEKPNDPTRRKYTIGHVRTCFPQTPEKPCKPCCENKAASHKSRPPALTLDGRLHWLALSADLILRQVRLHTGPLRTLPYTPTSCRSLGIRRHKQDS